MATTIVEQEKKMAISPNLEDTVSSTEKGVYYIQHKWVIDNNTLLPVGVQLEVTFPS